MCFLSTNQILTFLINQPTTIYSRIINVQVTKRSALRMSTVIICHWKNNETTKYLIPKFPDAQRQHFVCLIERLLTDWLIDCASTHTFRKTGVTTTQSLHHWLLSAHCVVNQYHRAGNYHECRIESTVWQIHWIFDGFIWSEWVTDNATSSDEWMPGRSVWVNDKVCWTAHSFVTSTRNNVAKWAQSSR